MDLRSSNLGSSFKHPQAGFTLLEILVVLFIIGIALGAAGLSIGAATKESRLTNEAARIVEWLNQIRNISIISNKTFRLSIDDPDMFIIQDYFEEAGEDNWEESNAVDKSRYVVSNGVETEWLFADDETTEIFIYPDSTYTRFELELSLNNKDSLTVLGQGVSPPKVANEEEAE